MPLLTVDDDRCAGVLLVLDPGHARVVPHVLHGDIGDGEDIHLYKVFMASIIAGRARALRRGETDE